MIIQNILQSKKLCGTDKRSIKYRQTAIQGGEDYIISMLDQADREMERMLVRIDRYQGQVTWICYKNLYFMFNK